MSEEYSNFMRSLRAVGEDVGQQRFLPVILGESLEAISPVVLPPEYQSWWNHIRSVRHLVFPRSFSEMQLEVRRIAEQVHTKRQNMLLESMQDF